MCFCDLVSLRYLRYPSNFTDCFRWLQEVNAALLFASSLGSKPMIEYLLVSKRADINALSPPRVCFVCDPVGKLACAVHTTRTETPLLAACLSGRDDAIEFLLAQGASPNVGDKVCGPCCLVPSHASSFTPRCAYRTPELHCIFALLWVRWMLSTCCWSMERTSTPLTT